jgi:cytoskeleton protein RodZ
VPVETGIGSTLREARNRRKVELSEAESATKIRLRYLRAMENEQWDVLPGGAYTRAFIRTYASYLGLDGERLADDYRRQEGPAPAERPPRVEAAGSIERGRSRRRGTAVAVVVGVALVGVLVGIGLAGNDGDEEPSPQPAAENPERPPAEQREEAGARRVTLELAANAEVWVCLIDGSGEELVDGQILAAGEEEGPFEAGRYTAAFGNGEISMVIDGEPADLLPSNSPVGYEIDSDGRLSELAEGERPSCE